MLFINCIVLVIFCILLCTSHRHDVHEKLYSQFCLTDKHSHKISSELDIYGRYHNADEHKKNFKFEQGGLTDVQALKVKRKKKNQAQPEKAFSRVDIHRYTKNYTIFYYITHKHLHQASSESDATVITRQLDILNHKNLRVSTGRLYLHFGKKFIIIKQLSFGCLILILQGKLEKKIIIPKKKKKERKSKY